MTAYRAVRRGADLRYGESEAVVATGAGSNILHFARAMGSDASKAGSRSVNRQCGD
ncbi:MAG: alcohol dehydrogenase [Propionibacterium sp. 4572_24]|nr:MAG: alcohol dehydrogenase [Propionibacterium sp. 4572_24]